jgi:hypothetical protein
MTCLDQQKVVEMMVVLGFEFLRELAGSASSLRSQLIHTMAML